MLDAITVSLIHARFYVRLLLHIILHGFFMFFECILHFYCWYFASSWNQIGGLYWKLILMLVVVLSVAINHRYRGCTVLINWYRLPARFSRPRYSRYFHRPTANHAKQMTVSAGPSRSRLQSVDANQRASSFASSVSNVHQITRHSVLHAGKPPHCFYNLISKVNPFSLTEESNPPHIFSELHFRASQNIKWLHP
jgi:hypothetical protein